MAQRNLWIGNLPASATQETLNEWFAHFGTITSCKVIQASKGTCGLVLFEDPSSAAQAVAEMHESEVEGQILIVKLANSDKKAAQIAGSGFVGAGYATPAAVPAALPPGNPSTNIWLGNLPHTYGDVEVSVLTAPYGTVTSLKVLKDRKGVSGEAAAMVNFATIHEATEAIGSLDGQLLPDSAKPLVAKYAIPKQQQNLPMQAMPAPMPMRPAVIPPSPRGVSQGQVNVWVGNLPPSYGEAELKALFGPYGAIASCKVLTDKATGRVGGAAMVMFQRPESAASAISSLNGYALNPTLKPLIVRAAARDTAPGATPVMLMAPPARVSYPPQPRKPAPQYVPQQAPAPISTNLWMGNLPSTCGEAEVSALCMQYGHVTSVKLLRGKGERSTEKACMVNFAAADEAVACVAGLNGAIYPGSSLPLIVKYSNKNFAAAIPQVYPQQAPVKTYGTPGAQMAQGSMSSQVTDNLWVGNVPPHYTAADVNSLFSTYGNVLSSVLLGPKGKGAGAKVAAMVRYSSCAEAAQAFAALDGYALDPSLPALIVKHATNKESGSFGGPMRGAGFGAQGYHPYAQR